LSYQALHARHYDSLYAHKPYAEEAAAVGAALARHGAEPPGRLLDVACGTGRHARAFGDFGWEVVGVDLNAELLEHGPRNAPGARFELQDMRELSVEGERFDVVTCLFDALGYVLTDHDTVRTLRAMAAHLIDGGLVACEVLHAPALLAEASPISVRRLDLADGGRLVRIAETEVDREARAMHVSYELIELGADGRWQADRERQSNRAFTVQELRALYPAGGLELLECTDSRSHGPVTGETWHVLAVGRIVQREDAAASGR
jgi:SAM-dependent methyltransferase